MSTFDDIPAIPVRKSTANDDHSPKRPKGVGRVSKEFAEETTAHGLGKITGEKGRLLQLFWVVIMIMALVLTLLMSYQRFSVYSTDPSSVVYFL